MELDEPCDVTLNADVLEISIYTFRHANNCILALSKDCRIKTLDLRTQVYHFPREIDDDTWVNCAESLARVLVRVKPVNLCLRLYWLISARVWQVICKSLKKHTTLQVLEFHDHFPLVWDGEWAGADQRQCSLAFNAVAEMVQENTMLHRVEVPRELRDEQLWTTRIQPCLDVNKVRPRVQELAENTDAALRRKAVGARLGAVRQHKDQTFHILRDKTAT